MHPTLLLLTFTGLITLTGHAASPTAQPDPLAPLRAAATQCYTQLHSQRSQGLPSEKNLALLKPLITPELHAILQRARTLQQRQIESHPDDKPDWIDGDVFSSFFEGVTQWTLGEAFFTPGTEATAKIDLTYTEPSQPPVSWTDTLVFKQRDNAWLLNDIRMGGHRDAHPSDSLRTRLPGGLKEQETHTSFDERWQIDFLRESGAITQVTIQPTDQSTQPQILLGDDPNTVCAVPTSVIWSPDGTQFAFHPGDSPRFTSTFVYRLSGKTWKKLDLPEFYPKEKATMLENGFRERQSLIDPEYWQDNHTLVVQYFGNFTKEDEGDGFSKFISIRFDPKGRPKITEALDTPGDL